MTIFYRWSPVGSHADRSSSAFTCKNASELLSFLYNVRGGPHSAMKLSGSRVGHGHFTSRGSHPESAPDRTRFRRRDSLQSTFGLRTTLKSSLTSPYKSLTKWPLQVRFRVESRRGRKEGLRGRRRAFALHFQRPLALHWN